LKIYNYGKGLDIVADLQASTKKVFLKQMKILFRTGNVKRFIPMGFFKKEDLQNPNREKERVIVQT
jgi:hypothetical protein